MIGRTRARGHTSRYLAAADVAKLHLGAGDNVLDGWLNTDRDPGTGLVHLDVSRPFPVTDASFDYVFAEHLIEHVPYATALGMLREAHRALAPDGRIRIATPDLRRLTGLLDDEGGDTGRRYAAWLRDSYFPDGHGLAATFALNQVVRGWGHQFVYDIDTLRATLEAAGFTDVAPRPFGDSDDPELVGVEAHGVADGNEELTRFETLVVEARRADTGAAPPRSARVAANA